MNHFKLICFFALLIVGSAMAAPGPVPSATPGKLAGEMNGTLGQQQCCSDGLYPYVSCGDTCQVYCGKPTVCSGSLLSAPGPVPSATPEKLAGEMNGTLGQQQCCSDGLSPYIYCYDTCQVYCGTPTVC